MGFNSIIILNWGDYLMFFSIAIPVYNAEAYLDKCIESVLNQTEKDYELIIVNDGSIDKSEKISKAWAEQYPDVIRYIWKENSGSLFTRRRCLEEAKGEYIYIMDADDYLLSTEMLSILKKEIIQTGSDLVFFNATNNESLLKPYFSYPFRENCLFEGASLKKIYEYILSNHGFNPLWNKVFHRDLVDWNEDYSAYDKVTNGTDFFQMLPIVTNAKKILYLPYVWYFYRTDNNSSSIVHKFSPTLYYSMRINWARLKEYSTLWGIDEQKRSNALRRRMMMITSTAANKVRLVRGVSLKKKTRYLKEVGEEALFREAYSTREIGIVRSIIVFLLYHRMYLLLAILLSFRG